MTTSIEAVLFDFGGVIIDSPFEAFDALKTTTGLTSAILRAVNSRNPDTNAWAQIERGRIDAERFAEQFAAEAAELGYEVDATHVIGVLTSLRSTREDARPGMIAAVDRCRHAGVRTAVITNNVLTMRATPDTAWVYESFDHVIESCVIGIRKPDPEFYEFALKTVGAAAERTAMLDDLGINLKPARALGIHTIKVGDAGTAARELDALLTAAGVS